MARRGCREKRVAERMGALGTENTTRPSAGAPRLATHGPFRQAFESCPTKQCAPLTQTKAERGTDRTQNRRDRRGTTYLDLGAGGGEAAGRDNTAARGGKREVGKGVVSCLNTHKFANRAGGGLGEAVFACRGQISFLSTDKGRIVFAGMQAPTLPRG